MAKKKVKKEIKEKTVTLELKSNTSLNKHDFLKIVSLTMGHFRFLYLGSVYVYSDLENGAISRRSSSPIDLVEMLKEEIWLDSTFEFIPLEQTIDTSPLELSML